MAGPDSDTQTTPPNGSASDVPDAGGAAATPAPDAVADAHAKGANGRKRKSSNGAHRIAEMRHDPEAIRHVFESGEYPYKQEIRTGVYERHKLDLQVELLKVQEWVK